MFINIPNNFSSMWGELTYEYNSTEQDDIIIEVYDNKAQETLGVKKFYSTQSAKINIAPLLFDSMMPYPERKTISTMVIPAAGFPNIKVGVEGNWSDSQVFSYAKNQLEPPVVLTTFPDTRMLYPGERDYVYLIAPSGTTIKYTLLLENTQNTSVNRIVTSTSSIDGGVRMMTIIADNYIGIYDKVTLNIFVDDQTISTIAYALSSTESNGYRLGWISSMGSVEQYTFPVTKSIVRHNSGATTRTLQSAYGLKEEIEALSEILDSPKVWHIDQDTYTQVEVLTTEHSLYENGALSIINIEVQEYD